MRVRLRPPTPKMKLGSPEVKKRDWDWVSLEWSAMELGKLRPRWGWAPARGSAGRPVGLQAQVERQRIQARCKRWFCLPHCPASAALHLVDGCHQIPGQGGGGGGHFSRRTEGLGRGTSSVESTSKTFWAGRGGQGLFLCRAVGWAWGANGEVVLPRPPTGVRPPRFRLRWPRAAARACHPPSPSVGTSLPSRN